MPQMSGGRSLPAQGRRMERHPHVLRTAGSVEMQSLLPPICGFVVCNDRPYGRTAEAAVPIGLVGPAFLRRPATSDHPLPSKSRQALRNDNLATAGLDPVEPWLRARYGASRSAIAPLAQGAVVAREYWWAVHSGCWSVPHRHKARWWQEPPCTRIDWIEQNQPLAADLSRKNGLQQPDFGRLWDDSGRVDRIKQPRLDP